jgi:hypothetical protein
MQATLKPNRNLAINGSGAVAQRNAGSVAITSSILYGSIDRFAAISYTAAGTISRITTGLPTAATNNVVFPSGFRFGRNNAVTNTGTIAISQALETINSTVAAGKQVTLSYWAKAGANYSSASSIFNANVQTGTGTDQAVNAGGGWTGFAFPLASTPTITTSWAFYSITGTVASTATQLEILFSYAPTGTAGADDNVYITGVQLEVGSAPSEFEFESFETTLRKCQRYFTRVAYSSGAYIATAMCRAANAAYWSMPLPVYMRIIPTISNALGTWAVVDAAGIGRGVGSFGYQTSGNNLAGMSGSGFNLVAGNAGTIFASTDVTFDASAEL